jgi:dienelactone hydrolase
MIITICGSTRFRREMQLVNRQLTLAGHVVLAPGVFQHDGDQITEAQKRHLDLLHYYKIDLAEAIYVVNPQGYIGESTRREVRYAIETGKRVMYLEEAV